MSIPKVWLIMCPHDFTTQFLHEYERALVFNNCKKWRKSCLALSSHWKNHVHHIYVFQSKTCQRWLNQPCHKLTDQSDVFRNCTHVASEKEKLPTFTLCLMKVYYVHTLPEGNWSCSNALMMTDCLDALPAANVRSKLRTGILLLLFTWKQIFIQLERKIQAELTLKDSIMPFI